MGEPLVLASGIALAGIAVWRRNLPLHVIRVLVDLALCTPLITLILPLGK